MRVALLGATGGLGSEVLPRLLARGNSVTALVRRPGSAKAPGVQEIIGDARDSAAIRAALIETDAVVDVLGSGTLGRNDLESSAMTNVVEAMIQLGPKRLIAMSAGMVARTFAFMDYMLKPTVFRHILVEHRRVEEIVTASDLDWTIVRPPRLVVRPARGYTISTGARYEGSMSIACGGVAEFIADELAQSDFVRQGVFVSEKCRK